MMLLSSEINNYKTPTLTEVNPNVNGLSSMTAQFRCVQTAASTTGYLSNSPKTVAMENQRREILQAFRDGRLGCRNIFIDREKTYLGQEKKNPRPMALLLEGVPIDIFILGALPVGLGIINPATLCAYKRDAITSPSMKLDELKYKCFADRHSLTEKMQEMGYRARWEVYNKMSTSGHLKPDGVFSPSKIKSSLRNVTNYGNVFYTELVSSSYDKKQIKCFIIETDIFNYTKRAFRFSEILEEKHEAELKLGIEKLPLAFYSSLNGALQIWFEEEIFNSYKKVDIKEADFVPLNIAPLNIAPLNIAPLNIAPLNIAPLNSKKRIRTSPDEALPAKIPMLATCQTSYTTQAKANKFATLLNDFSISSDSSGNNKVTVDCEEEQNSPSVMLKTNEELLDNFCIAAGVSIKSIWNMLYTLPFPLVIKTLQTARLNTNTDTVSVSEIIRILSDPLQYNVKRLCELVPGKFCSKVFYKGFYISLIHLLIDSEESRENSTIPSGENDLINYMNTETSREAISLYHELLRKGEQVQHNLWQIALHAPIFFNSSVAFGGLAWTFPESTTYMNDKIFYKLPEDSIGRTVSIDQTFGEAKNDKIQATLLKLLTNFKTTHKIEPRLHNVLLTMFYYGADPRALQKELVEDIAAWKQERANAYSKIFGTQSPTEYVQSVISLYQERKTHPYYSHWPEKVEQAKKEINELRQNIGPLYDKQDKEETPDVRLTERQSPFQFLIDAFNTPPILPQARDDNETVLKILDHYYRRPGPEQVCRHLSDSSFPRIWKPLHSCCHVLRARNNAYWYMELLEQFHVMDFTDQEKALLALAMIYHDAAAEDVSKHREESVSASYFKRDLTGYFPEPLLEIVALALESKEDDVHGKDENSLDPKLRNYIRVLRFGDRMDYIRCAEISHDFPDLTGTNAEFGFDPHRLDLPLTLKEQFTPCPEQKPPFQLHLEAAMHGAADLASVTGGFYRDHREKGTYASRYSLQPDNTNLQQSFEKTPIPLTILDRFMDDNVRRTIAKKAGIQTCTDPDHKQCKTDTVKGVARGIHNSWYDLKQIGVPAGMTRLEKMQCEHNLDVLRETTRQAIQKEVERLKCEGIPMNLGTLTQDTLKSPAAQAVLEGRGISVVQEKRPRGYKPSGEKNFEIRLVPVFQAPREVKAGVIQ